MISREVAKVAKIAAGVTKACTARFSMTAYSIGAGNGITQTFEFTATI
jgi:hypothetical protein